MFGFYSIFAQNQIGPLCFALIRCVSNQRHARLCDDFIRCPLVYIYNIFMYIVYIYISLLYRVNRSTLLSFLIKSETGAYNITRACPRGVPDTLAPTNGAETVIMHKKYSTFLTRIQNSTIDILKRIYFQIFQ